MEKHIKIKVTSATKTLDFCHCLEIESKLHEQEIGD